MTRVTETDKISKPSRFYIFKLPINNPGWGRELKGDKFNIDDRVPVWTETIDWLTPTDEVYVSEVLDKLFEMFNINIPTGYAAPSMSVGDIVELHTADGPKFYACMCVGWKEVQAVQGDYHA